MFKFGLQ